MFNNKGIIISDREGVPIKTTFNDEQTTYFYTTSASLFINRCEENVRELLKGESLTFIRIRTKLNEIMIAPDKDFILIVVQNPSSGGN